LQSEVRKVYRQKELEFPVTVAMARFMSDRVHAGPGGQRYDREGLYRWSLARFGKKTEEAPVPEPAAVVAGDNEPNYVTAVMQAPAPAMTLSHLGLSEEDFRTHSRTKLHELLLDVSKKTFPAMAHEEIDERLAAAFHGTDYSEEEDARELSEWVRKELGMEIPVEALTGITQDRARDILWNAFDERNRPEMKRMERSLLLNQLDNSWKNHLYVMDHLRQGIGLVGYAQIDPKTEYKRQGMKEFEAMWEGVQDKVSDTVFRMEDDESFQESVWSIGAATHESAPSTITSMRGQQDAAIAGSQQTAIKKEPIRNRSQRVGRNDPCPCGSGKKYKNCCMRLR